MLRSLPRILLLLGLGAYTVAFSWLLHLRHDRFSSFDFDLGIFDQNVWLLSRGLSFMTVRGLEVFGHHASFGHFLFVPFYWLGAGPNFLDDAMVIAVALAAVVVFRIATRLSGSEWIALILALAFAWHPTMTWLLQETYHPEVMAILPLFLAFDAGQRGRWLVYAVSLAVAASFKEDVALAAMMMGVVFALRGERKVGAITAVIALAYFVFVIKVLIPHYAPQGVFFQQFYSHLGLTPGEVIKTAIVAPDRVFHQLEKADAVGYAGSMVLSYGIAAMFSPLPLLIGLPQFAANLLSQYDFTWSVQFHYAALVLAATTLATVEGVCLRERDRARWHLAILVAICTIIVTVAYGIGPGSLRFRQGAWPLIDKPRYRTLERALALPGSDDSIAGTYNVVPHLTHREHIYRFPNPWWPEGWGVHGENPDDPATIQWLVLDRQLLGSEEKSLLEHLRAEENWSVRLDEDDLLVLHREKR